MRHTHAEAVGEIRERWPWTEDTWGFDWAYLVHWQQEHLPSTSSHLVGFRHTWRLHIPRLGIEFAVRCGKATHAS